VIAFSRLVNASSSATVQGRVEGIDGGGEEGGTRARDSDDIFFDSFFQEPGFLRENNSFLKIEIFTHK
jgi:hypothetical protein